jgi:pilus assembly protein CpaE
MADNQTLSDVFLSFVSDKDTLEVTKTLALSRYGLKVDARQGNIKSAIAYLKFNHSPRLLLVDITGSEFPLSDMKALAEVCEPGLQVLAVGDRNDVGIFRDLVGLGVKDYIAKPLAVSLLIHSIEILMGATAAHKKADSGFAYAGKLISFLGARGGVGSSTLAANFSWVLAHGHYKRVCLLDLDFHYGVLSQIFNQDPTTSFSELLSLPDRLDEAILMKSVQKVSDYLVTLSSQVPVDEDFTYPSAALEACMPLLLNQFHYTVLDLPRYDHKNHYPILSRSNVIVLSLDFTLLCVREVANLLRVFKSTQEVQIVIVANRQGEYKKGELDKAMFEDSIGQEIDLIIPFDAIKPLQILNEGALVASERGVLSDGIYKLTKIITGKEAQISPHKTSLLGGLFGGGKTVD